MSNLTRHAMAHYLFESIYRCRITMYKTSTFDGQFRIEIRQCSNQMVVTKFGMQNIMDKWEMIEVKATIEMIEMEGCTKSMIVKGWGLEDNGVRSNIRLSTSEQWHKIVINWRWWLKIVRSEINEVEGYCELYGP